jgi:hypothetical protein
MGWNYGSRADLLQRLERATLGKTGIEELRTWLNDLLVNADTEVDEASAPLIHASVQRLDVVSADDRGLQSLARELLQLVRMVKDETQATDLLPLVEERERFIEMLQKVLNSTISRTAFLSYLTERRWTTNIKRRISAMDRDRLNELEKLLADRDYERLAMLLSE